MNRSTESMPSTTHSKELSSAQLQLLAIAHITAHMAMLSLARQSSPSTEEELPHEESGFEYYQRTGEHREQEKPIETPGPRPRYAKTSYGPRLRSEVDEFSCQSGYGSLSVW